MKNPTRCLALFALALLLGPPARLAAAPQSPSHDAAARVDELMAKYDDGPGGVVAVVRGGEVIFAKAYGVANIEHGVPMTRETVLDVGSVAKQFTAFAIVLLTQEGKLSLDDDIRKHLPEIPDFGTVITVRHLVHHMSGLREIYNSSALAGWKAGDGIAQEDAIHLIARMRELNFEPGSEYMYCNTGYMLLSDIVARVSGVPFHEFMAENVFGPLGMKSTTIMTSFGQSIPNAAESYGPADGGGFVRIFDNSTIQGAGGIYTTVDDLAAWMSNYREATVGGMSAIEQMQQHGVLTSGRTLPYAFGITVGERRGQRTFSHGGSSAGYRSSFTYFSDLDGGVITLSNFARFDGSIADQLIEAFFGDHLEPMPEWPEASSANPVADPTEPWVPGAAELAALQGQYFSPELETIYTLVVEDGKLIAKHRRHSDFELTPTEQDVYEGASFFGSARIERNAAGDPTGMRVSNGRVRDLLFEKRGG